MIAGPVSRPDRCGFEGWFPARATLFNPVDDSPRDAPKKIDGRVERTARGRAPSPVRPMDSLLLPEHDCACPASRMTKARLR
jgi:hypothetical protein